MSLCGMCLCLVEDDYRVVRSCATDGRVGQCVDRTGTSRIKLRYCECHNEHADKPCNSAVGWAPTSLWIIVFAVGTAAVGVFAMQA